MFCPHCGAQFTDRVSFCPRCGKAQQGAPPSHETNRILTVAAPNRAIWTRKGVWITLGLVAAASVVAATFSNLVNNVPPHNKQDEQTFSETPMIGRTYKVQSSKGFDSVPGLDSEEIFDQLEEDSSLNDDYGVKQILGSGHALLIPNGTSVLVLDISVLHNWCKVRVMSGLFYGNIEYLHRSLTGFKPVAGDSQS
jgi:hypothetical protein